MSANISKSIFFFLEATLNFLIITIVCLIAYNLVLLIRSFRKKQKFRFYFFDSNALLLILAFCFLGFAIGLLIGLSQSAVVHVAIPALLTFYGGFLTYLFAKDSFRDNLTRNIILISVIAVSVFLVYGVEIGSSEKNNAVKTQKDNELYYLDRQEEIKKRYR